MKIIISNLYLSNCCACTSQLMYRWKQIKSYDVVSDCVKYTLCSVSNSIYKRKTNFLAKLKCSDNVLIGLSSNVISMELYGLQLNYACTWSELDIVHYFIHLHFLSRVSTLTRDIDIRILSVCLSVRPSVCPSVRDLPVLDKNGLTYCHNFLPYGSPIILVLPPSNIFTKFWRVTPYGDDKSRAC